MKIVKLAVVLLAGLAVSQAVATMQTGPGSIEGFVADVDGGALPGVAVQVASPSLTAPLALTTNGAGRFNASQVPAGAYQISLSLSGFRTSRGMVGVKSGAASTVTFQMSLGSLTETVTVRSAAPVLAAQPAQPAPTGPIRVGGSIREPKKIRDVKPVFPAAAEAAGAEGVVVIEAVIGREGDVTSARVLQGVPLLNAAAIEAVREWRYTPTLLNGRPVEVSATVTVSFIR